jgi:hypothetical protein
MEILTFNDTEFAENFCKTFSNSRLNTVRIYMMKPMQVIMLMSTENI